MKRENKKKFLHCNMYFMAFLLWTVAIRFVDVEAIGPQGTSVGFATINRFVHNLAGVHMSLYVITDWLSLVPLAFVIGFALLGLIQWIKRKHLLKVDYNILVLGGFYIVVMAVYVLFETVVVNYRPILINGCLEVSYPSSTTILVLCVMPTAFMQFSSGIKKEVFKRFIAYAITFFIIFMVVGRLISGVHWFSDIIGGVLLSVSLVLTYRVVINCGVK